MSGRDIPALFSAPMVRANLREVDPKTMTRRPLYVLTKRINTAKFDSRYPMPPMGPGHTAVGEGYTLSGWAKAKPGDRIWQRETWSADPPIDDSWASTQWSGCGRKTSEIPERFQHPRFCNYAADWLHGPIVWTPSIHMPRWACRFEALIKAVRIERLQDISEADAIADGIEERANAGQDSARWRVYGTVDTYTSDPVSSYQSLWESINGAGSWAENPWVVVITYERIKEA